ncbi:MAG: hypothetical protein HDT37_09385 [Clostridiales bacterium]|nr:hypothetical protein [Clostridiales bacterium]
MRTKQYISLLLAALMALTLTACGAALKKDNSTAMTIAPAQLSEEEAALAELLALDMDSYHIYDFYLSEKSGIQSLCLTAYELVNGEWMDVAAEVHPFSDVSGRISLTFGKMTDGVQTAVQGASATNSSSFAPVSKGNVSDMTFATSALDDASTTIEPDQEIPLVLQVVTSKNEVRMYKVDYFGMPRELDKQGYEHVYAITVTFSQTPPDELVRSIAPGVPQEPSAEPSPAN